MTTKVLGGTCPTCGQTMQKPSIKEAMNNNNGKRKFTVVDEKTQKPVGEYNASSPAQAAKKAANIRIIDKGVIGRSYRFKIVEILDKRNKIYGKTYEFLARRSLYATPKVVVYNKGKSNETVRHVTSYIELLDP